MASEGGIPFEPYAVLISLPGVFTPLVSKHRPCAGWGGTGPASSFQGIGGLPTQETIGLQLARVYSNSDSHLNFKMSSTNLSKPGFLAPTASRFSRKQCSHCWGIDSPEGILHLIGSPCAFHYQRFLPLISCSLRCCASLPQNILLDF